MLSFLIISWNQISQACPSYITFADIDECDTDNGGCIQACIDTEGSYSCDCYQGYTSTDDGISCSSKIAIK